MRHALLLAKRGARAAMPNPCVGAVIVHNDTIVGEGYHEKFGEAHAEVNAIRSMRAPELLSSSTMYVTLEPCAHFGKTPPCADLLISSRIPRVVVGCRDPFPQVAGLGIEKLRAAGIEVIEDVLRDECVITNRRFILAHRNQRPYIILKWAQSADGFIAPLNRAPLWLTSETSRHLVHRWRAQEMAILVGRTTARQDNPLLTVRHTDLCDPSCLPARNPIRVVIDPSRALPHSLNVFNNESETVVFTTNYSAREGNIRWHALEGSHPFTPQICRELYNNKILSLLVEGGADTLRHFIDADLWDEARVFIAPRKLGEGIPAPRLSSPPVSSQDSGGDELRIWLHPQAPARLGLPTEVGPLLGESLF